MLVLTRKIGESIKINEDIKTEGNETVITDDSEQVNIIEKSDSIVSKVEDAINYLGSDKITLNPDCGFAPSSSNPMDLDEAYLKLKELSSASLYLKNKYL